MVYLTILNKKTILIGLAGLAIYYVFIKKPKYLIPPVPTYAPAPEPTPSYAPVPTPSENKQPAVEKPSIGEPEPQVPETPAQETNPIRPSQTPVAAPNPFPSKVLNPFNGYIPFENQSKPSHYGFHDWAQSFD